MPRSTLPVSAPKTSAPTRTVEGEPLEPGDIVKVPDAREDGWKRVTVVSISDEAPPFVRKADPRSLYNPEPSSRT